MLWPLIRACSSTDEIRSFRSLLTRLQGYKPWEGISYVLHVFSVTTIKKRFSRINDKGRYCQLNNYYGLSVLLTLYYFIYLFIQ